MFLITAAKAVFTATLPLVDIAGLGLIVNALVNNAPKSSIVRLILIFVSLNLCIGVLSNLLSYFSMVNMRRASDLIQLDYVIDSIRINYHYAQDGTILNLKNKSIGANPA